MCTKLGESCNVANYGKECAVAFTPYPLATVAPTPAPTPAAVVAVPPATPVPTTSTTEPTVVVTYVLNGVNYAKLMANPTLKAELELAQKEAVALEAGPEITISMVVITFSAATARRLDGRRLAPGDTSTSASITPPTATAAPALQAKLQSSPTLASTVTTKSAGITGIAAVQSGTISAGPVTASVSTPAGSTSGKHVSLCASYISWGPCFSALTAGKTTAEITQLCGMVKQKTLLPADTSQDIVAMNAYYLAATGDRHRMDKAMEKTGHCGTK